MASSKILPPRGYGLEDTEARLRWLEQKVTGHTNPADVPEDSTEDLKGIIENHIGYMPMPMAVAGPLRVHGDHANGDFYVPLCTIEGTLALSMMRGMYVGYLSGGFKTTHIKQELSRSPGFTFKSNTEVKQFMEWVENNFEAIKEVAEKTTSHGKLLRIDKYPVHNRLICDLVYSTGDAGGQNMTTIATMAACEFIASQNPNIQRWLVESNFNGDKNATQKTALNGRGHYVITSLEMPKKVAKRILRVEPDDLIQGYYDAIMGSKMCGQMGFNLHSTNALTALYLALGQDAACATENSSAAHLFIDKTPDGNLLFSLTCPSLSVGTVGGGTRLGPQRRNLESIDCYGAGKAKKLAEIIAASCLALEISLGGAIASGEFSDAHAKFGR
jgi:hydroxymethylglutaryl-CoA reductase (NADPH)